MTNDDLKRLAWMVEIDTMTCVVFSTTRSKAQWIATRNYWDAYGRQKGEWPRAKAWRAPIYDNSRLATEQYQRAWREDAVMETVRK